MARIILFWCFENSNCLGRIMKSQVQFWHPSDLRLWRTGCIFNVKIDETQIPIAPEHAFKEKSAKILILLPLRTVYFRTFQCETSSNKETCTYFFNLIGSIPLYHGSLVIGGLVGICKYKPVWLVLIREVKILSTFWHKATFTYIVSFVEIPPLRSR